MNADAQVASIDGAAFLPRCDALSALGRDLLAAPDRSTLVEMLVHGRTTLLGGRSALFEWTNPEFVHVCDCRTGDHVRIRDDVLLRAAIERGGVVQNAAGLCVAILVPAFSMNPAYVLMVESADDPFDATDIAGFALLGYNVALALGAHTLMAEVMARRTANLELTQAKNDVIAMLAHDVRGSLTAIIGLAEMVTDVSCVDDDVRAMTETIRSSASRLATMATETLELANHAQHELLRNVEDVDLLAVVREAARAFRVVRAIDVYSAAEPLVIRGDAQRLQQVFEALLGNAIKYSPGGDVVDVTIGTWPGRVEIAIRDYGIGIAPTDALTLFARFARGSNARRLAIGGSGFGLFLSRAIVERHGGQLSFESQEGVGSTFRVMLPTISAHAYAS